MNNLKIEAIGKYIDVLTDYHSNGSYELLKHNVTLLDKKNYAVMIRTLNFERENFTDDLIYVDESSYTYLAKSKVFPDDILINKIASPGSIYIMPDLKVPVTCGMNLFLVRFSNKVDQKYMYYCLKNSEEYIKSFAHGTTTKTITKDEIKNIKLLIHSDISEQKQITAVLSALDEKINLNKKINATLEDMAKTLYLHLFFRRPPNGKLGDLITENTKSTISVGDAKDSGGNFPFFTSGENILRWNEYLVDGRNIFMNDGGNVGIKFYVGKAAYSTHTYCITAENGLADYLYLFLETIQTEIEKRFFTGTGLKNLRKDLLHGQKVYIPTQTEIEDFNSKIQPCFDMISKNRRENNRVAEIRDFLLPLLMNGQVGFEE